MVRIHGDEAENVYINAEIFNDTDRDIPCNYDETFTDAVLKKADDYVLSIVRFSLPNTNPILFFKLTNTTWPLPTMESIINKLS